MSHSVAEQSVYTASYVKARLEEAGACLMALPAHKTAPAAYKVMWPEIKRSWGEGFNPDEEPDPDAQVRISPPSARAITEMDEAFMHWLPLLDDAVETRRLLLLRSLIWPRSRKHVWSWRKLQDRIGLHRETLQIRHARGIDRIVTRLNLPAWKPLPASRLP